MRQGLCRSPNGSLEFCTQWMLQKCSFCIKTQATNEAENRGCARQNGGVLLSKVSRKLRPKVGFKNPDDMQGTPAI